MLSVATLDALVPALHKMSAQWLEVNPIFKMLKLVLFLDRAASAHLLPGHLFVKESAYKSSTALVSAFGRQFLRGEADIVRHLHFLGYSLQYEQTFLDEFEWKVTSLATDLVDGVRLAKLVEMVAGVHNLLSVRPLGWAVAQAQ